MNILDSVILVELEKEHLELILTWRNQEQIRNVMFSDKVVTLEEHFKWFESIQNDKTVKVLLFYLQTTPLGIITISKIDSINGTCEWGFYIGPKDAPKGSGTIMGYTALNYIFSVLNMRKICAKVLDFNKKSLAFHEKLGFSYEGKLISHINKADQYCDVFLLAIFKEQWKKSKYKIRNLIEGKKL